MNNWIILFFTLLLIISITSNAQDSNPTLLPEPEDWKFEKIDFPLDFAPDIEYKGFEELRFAPGMFDTLSNNYFTYIFALSIADKATIGKNEMELFLVEYYKGLCSAVAESKKQTVDISKIKARVKKSKRGKNKTLAYSARVNFIDVFTNGKEVVLNMELELYKNSDKDNLYLLALVSPHKMDSKVWTNLHNIRNVLKEKSSLF